MTLGSCLVLAIPDPTELPNASSNPQLWYMRQIALPQLLLINVVIDIYGLVSNIASKLLHEIPRHACSDKMCCEPMATAVWCEVILNAF